MKKLLPILFIILLMTSCTLHDSVEETGYISFAPSQGKGVTASISYPSLLDKVWTLSAVKADNGARTGEGQYEDIVLTDSVGPFSTGRWTFTVTTDGITGTATTTIKPGTNTISITVQSTANKGTLSMENCDFLESKAGHVLYVDLYVDDQRLNAPWTANDFTTDDGDLYSMPVFTTQLAEGIHTVRLYYGTDNGGFSSDPVSVRIVNGTTTHLTIGEQEGNISVLVSFDTVEALVNE